MKSSIVAYIEFSFKGECFAPSITLDLDQILEREGQLPDIHSAIAMISGIDAYSYEYEMMQAEAVCYKQAEGLAAEFVHGDSFDIEGFERQWYANKMYDELQAIAQRCMAIEDLSSQPELKAALKEAYQRGKAAPRSRYDL